MSEKLLRFVYTMLNRPVYFLLFLHYPVSGTDMKLGPGINLDTVQEPIELFENCWPNMIILYFCEINSVTNKHLIII